MPQDAKKNHIGHTIDTGHLLWTAAKIMHNNSEEDATIEVLDTLECLKSKHCVHCSDNMKAITHTIRLTMMEINEIQEKHRERRHRELVELFEKYLGGNDLKGPDISSNIMDHTKNNLEVTKNTSEKIIQTKPAKDVSNSQEILFDGRKRKTASIDGSNIFETPIQKLINPTIQAAGTNSSAETEKISQRDELFAMRHQMLAMQRRKMEERERKKRENSKV